MPTIRRRQCRVPTIRRRQCRVPTINRGRETALGCPLDHSGATGIDISEITQNITSVRYLLDLRSIFRESSKFVLVYFMESLLF